MRKAYKHRHDISPDALEYFENEQKISDARIAGTSIPGSESISDEPGVENDENYLLTPKNLEIFSAFAVTLKRVHVRLIAEGYIINNGQITKSERLLAYEQDNNPKRKNN